MMALDAAHETILRLSTRVTQWDNLSPNKSQSTESHSHNFERAKSQSYFLIWKKTLNKMSQDKKSQLVYSWG